MDLSHLAIKRPDISDIPDLAPVAVAVVIWFVYSRRSGGSSAPLLLPALAAVVVWLLLKGLRYVPR